MNIISVKNLSKDFGQERVLHNVTRDFERGRIHGLTLIHIWQRRKEKHTDHARVDSYERPLGQGAAGIGRDNRDYWRPVSYTHLDVYKRQ